MDPQTKRTILISIMIVVIISVTVFENRTRNMPEPNIFPRMKSGTGDRRTTRKYERLSEENPLKNRDIKQSDTKNQHYVSSDTVDKQQGRTSSLYYCAIPKCGTTFMFGFLKSVLSCRNCTPLVSKRSTESNTFAFTIVRQPYHRLFSAYENKLFHPNKFWKILGKDIIKTVRSNATELSKSLGHDVTFKELVEYVVTLYSRNVTLNQHVRPMRRLCNPRSAHFDYTLRLENMTKDLETLVEFWKTKGVIFNNNLSAGQVEGEIRDKQAVSGRVTKLYETIRRVNPSVSPYGLMKRNWRSFQIRGMVLKKFELPVNRSDALKIKQKDYANKLWTAVLASKNREALKRQREEAFLQAYQTVPLELLERLKDVLKEDCIIFGYDTTPPAVFHSRDIKRSRFDYFCDLL